MGACCGSNPNPNHAHPYLKLRLLLIFHVLTPESLVEQCIYFFLLNKSEGEVEQCDMIAVANVRSEE